ncbi:N-myc proto-oncogene protein-like, partial [Heterodontus francisci]|uniref:N-myc proto-oncogene protein-like n=1 Tax=Heterodontus francisci TaxID=7792 RepID=UPI00355B2EF0
MARVPATGTNIAPEGTAGQDTSAPSVTGLPTCKDPNIVTVNETTKVPIKAEETKGDAVLHLREDALPVSSPLISEIESQSLQDLSGSGLESTSPYSEMPHQENEDPNSDGKSSLSTGSASSCSSDSEDVITIEKHRLAVGKSPRTGTHLQTLASIKQSRLAIQQQHNYAAPSLLLSREPPAPQRARKVRYLHEAKYSFPNNSSPLSLRPSDAEDEERRWTRNVLKRQRRNELKLCLLAFCDEVTELSKNDKASEVVILRKATEYVSRLKAEQQKLNAEREKFQKKQQQLRRKFSK